MLFRSQVKFAVSAKKTTEQIRAEVVEKAPQFEIPDIGPRDIHITRRGPAFNLILDYSVPINLRLYKWDATFHVDESGEIFDQ